MMYFLARCRGEHRTPTVGDIYKYRLYVDKGMSKLLEYELPKELRELVLLGLSHEEQHQELLYADIKYILGHNPLFPAYSNTAVKQIEAAVNKFLEIPEGIYEIGFEGNGFCFDNELGRHKVYLQSHKIASQLVTNAEYIEFINDGGYNAHQLWHAEGLDWVKNNHIVAPLYWHNINGVWHDYTLNGLQKVDMSGALEQISVSGGMYGF